MRCPYAAQLSPALFSYSRVFNSATESSDVISTGQLNVASDFTANPNIVGTQRDSVVWAEWILGDFPAVADPASVPEPGTLALLGLAGAALAWIGVGNGARRPLPPNPLCSSPATGSPVSCFRIGIGAPLDELRTS